VVFGKLEVQLIHKTRLTKALVGLIGPTSL